MNNTLHFERLFVYSEKHNLISNIEFSDGLNIIYGKNTSGKSTLYHSILYALGVNEYNTLLSEILQYEPIFRFDCYVQKQGKKLNFTFVRNDNVMTIKDENGINRRFVGVNSNNSNEHIRLKEYIADIFHFTMKLEQNGKIKDAPIEAMILPYFVSQSIGWVYIRKSFANLEFYKNFKEDYLDYYTGISNDVDREEKTRLERMKKQYTEQFGFYENIVNSNPDLEVSRLEDEENEKYSLDYLEETKNLNMDLVKMEKEYTLKCNELAYISKRIGVLSTVRRNTAQQTPETGNCPTCNRAFGAEISDWYKYLQEKNDTDVQINEFKKKSVSLKSEINSLQKKLVSDKTTYSEKYSILMSKYSKKQSYKRWLENKTNILLVEKCKNMMFDLKTKIDQIEIELKKYKSDDAIQSERRSKSNEFARIFKNYMGELGIHTLDDTRYINLYEISAFPLQGVELHKTVMAYHFAFNKIIRETKGIHRFPFMLDAIFKEDIETDNKETILKFISNNIPSDTQTVISIAESIKDNEVVKKYNRDYFGSHAHLICIGESQNERAFLNEYKHEYIDYVDETMRVLYAD